MSPNTFCAALLGTVLAFGTGTASAATITFEGMVRQGTFVNYMPGTTLNPTPEFAFTTSGGVTAVADSAALAAIPNYSVNGTAFLAMSLGASALMTSTSNSLFSVNSIDLANLLYTGDPDNPAADIMTATLIGTYGKGGTVMQSYDFQNNNIVTTMDFATVALTGFVDLTSFAIIASGPSFGLSVDNIVINETQVPEPGMLAMLSLGLAGIAAARRRKRSA